MLDNVDNLRTVVILTAIPVEFKAVKTHLPTLTRVKHPSGTIYREAIINTSSVNWKVIVCEIGAGNINSALEAERAISFFTPDIIAFVGIAGGLKDVSIGDVVVATKVYGYEAGKAREEFQPRPEVFRSSYELVQEARATQQDEVWTERLTVPPSPLPSAFIAPIAAGEKVIASTYSEAFTLIKSNYSDALAVEMEGIGLLAANYANHHVQAIIIRGISDLIDGKSASDASGTQEIAAAHASAFFFEMLSNLTQDPDISTKQQTLPIDDYKPPKKKEILFSNLLPLIEYPSTIYTATTDLRTSRELWERIRSIDPSVNVACTIKSGLLITCADLHDVPWSAVCDKGTIECHAAEDWALSDDEEEQKLFVELLNVALAKQFHDEYIGYISKFKVYYFQRHTNQSSRRISYQSKKKQASREVVKAYYTLDESPLFKYFRHFACEGRFKRHDHQWYLEITPTYIYTKDGRNIIQASKDLNTGMKKVEGNSAVLGQVVMWSSLLTSISPVLFRDTTRALHFGALNTFECDYGIFDHTWSNQEPKSRVSVFESSQISMDLQ